MSLLITFLIVIFTLPLLDRLVTYSFAVVNTAQVVYNSNFKNTQSVYRSVSGSSGARVTHGG